MNQEVILMFVVFTLYFLIPLIPAVLIYKLFPDSKVSASGPLSGLTVKTTGAFAAYLISLISGVFIINNTIEIIKESLRHKNETLDYLWQVKCRPIIKENDTLVSQELADRLLKGTVINMEPSPNYLRFSDDYYLVYVPDNLLRNNVTIKYSVSQCETKQIIPNSSKYKRDDERKEIDVGDLILRKSSLVPNTYTTSVISQPVPAPSSVLSVNTNT